MNTLTLSGIIRLKFDRWNKIKLVSEDGYQLDLVGRFQEMMDTFPKHKVQINYWVTDKQKTKDEMMEGWLKQVFGSIDAEYGSDTFNGSSMTGSWTEDYTTLQVGGHNLYNEISSYEGKFILIELNFSHKTKK